MEIKKWKNPCLGLPTLMLAALLLGMLGCPTTALAATYADSAHGDATNGVNRPSKPDATGGCVHCHETSDSAPCRDNAHMLFYGTQLECDHVCFECHADTYANEQQVTNYPYSIFFGGFSTLHFPSIKHQFCATQARHAGGGSNHNLVEIWSTIKDNGNGWGFGANPNPCGACHNPHLSQKSGNTPFSPPYDPSKSPLTRPAERHSTNPVNLWGDDATERMDYYAEDVAGGYYQAPYYGSFDSGLYEPAGDGTSDGSNLPDYVTFCMDCHQDAQYDPESGEAVKAIRWGPPWSTVETSDIHGAAPANTRDGWSIGCMASEGPLRAPYDTYEPNESNYVLSCLDCHEPHGTYQRPHLIRVEINGEFVADSSEVEICERCHDLQHPYGSCNGCHGKSGGPAAGFHGSTFECASDPGCDGSNPENCPPSF
ncbi:MAG: cytochrome c3 family protein [Thermodesulfobacteriota bacterium]|nr:cytochrome c3 family protein [Thermodesulfobacteriota bacterium]